MDIYNDSNTKGDEVHRGSKDFTNLLEVNITIKKKFINLFSCDN